MATPADAFPAWRQTVPPTSYSRFGRQAMLDEKQPATRLENPAHLGQRCSETLGKLLDERTSINGHFGRCPEHIHERVP
jgi:hypothetical protein